MRIQLQKEARVSWIGKIQELPFSVLMFSEHTVLSS